MKSLSSEDSRWVDFVKATDAKVLMKGADAKGIPYLRHVFRVYALLFGEACTGCPDKIPHYIQQIKNLKTTEKMDSKKPKFKLKDGTLIFAPDGNGYSEHNITDEIAIELLKVNPNRKTLFAVLPDDWEKLIEDEVEKTPFEELVNDNSKAQLIEKAAALGIEDVSGNKNELAQAILDAEETA